MAPQPAPPNPAAGPTKAAAKGLKKIPLWGWLIAGGAVLGLGYRAYQDRRTPDTAVAEEPPAGEDFETYDLSEQPSPVGVVNPVIAGPDSGETVGAVGQTALETGIGGITGIIEGLPGIIGALRDPAPQIIRLPATPAPAPAPVPRKPAQTKKKPKGITVAGRFFPGARSAKEIRTPKLKSRDFNIYWDAPHKDQRWRREPNGKWRKLADF